jgi:hypothetical protein
MSQRDAGAQFLEQRPAATEAERAVERVSKTREYEKVFPAGF